MIKTEEYMVRSDGIHLYKTYSNASMMIRQEPTGYLYEEAIDVADAPYTYIETNLPIEDEISDSEALNIIMGRPNNEPNDSDEVQEEN